ncbi:hypothetical protein [Dactylosporangium sp. CS-033363]|uniref:hypothetical protein n=1 Tax=Dactylosporangium sp. CS-033363 TaxID=3239935 RepID=UPI003D8C5542
MRRTVGLLGLGWLVLFAIGGPVLQGRPPGFDMPAAELRAQFQQHATRYLAGDFIAGAGFCLLLVPFAAFLPDALGVVARTGWARLASSSAVGLTAAGGAVTSFLDAIAIAHGGPQLDDATLSMLLYANSAGIAFLGLPAATFATAAGALAWLAGRRGLAMFGWLAATLLLAGAAFPLGAADGPLWTIRFAGFVVLAAFVAATSITLLGPRRADPGPVELFHESATAEDRPA